MRPRSRRRRPTARRSALTHESRRPLVVHSPQASQADRWDTPATSAACSIADVEPAPHPAVRARPRLTRGAGVDPFADLPPFYDLDVDGYDEDIDLYQALAAQADRSARSPARVLELGCGTGRVAASLAVAGHPVVAVDRSEAMLARCRERCDGLPVRSLRGDMRTLDLGERFRLVLVPLGGLEHMASAAELASALATVERHLAPGGLAVVDVAAPQPEDLAPGVQPLLEQWTRDLPTEGSEPGARVTKLVSVEAQPSEGSRDVTWHFDVQPAGGALHRVTVRFALRMITAGELELAATLAGLRATGWYGDYDLAPLAAGAERILVTLRRARRRRST